MRKFLPALLIAGVFAVAPLSAYAVTADELRAQIADLLNQIYSLRAQLQNDVGTPVPATVGTPVSVSSSSGVDATFKYSRCPDLKFDLERGMRDANVAEEVSMLQRFLSQDASIYPDRLVTGYFGPATERAVQNFQQRHGIVNAGDYQATGYGRVGPRTRWAIKNSCDGAGAYAFFVNPLNGLTPLQVKAQFEVAGSSCTSYELNWGDGSAPVYQGVPENAVCPNDTLRKSATHTYVQPGTYTVTLKAGRGAVNAIPLVARALITAQDGAGAGPADGTRSSLAVSGTEGRVPFTVTAVLRSETAESCTSYEVNWGDGTAPIQYQTFSSGYCGAGAFEREFVHTYTQAGTFTIQARAGASSLGNLSILSQPVRVLAGGDSSADTGCFVVPNAGSVPLSASARILLGGTLCDGRLTYQVDWGDGNISAARTCNDQNSHYEYVNHTYDNAGAYIAILSQSHPNARFAEQSCDVSATAKASTQTPIVSSSCRNWYDGCNTCARDYVGGPGRCTLRGCQQYGAPQCYSYFGEGGTIPQSDSLTGSIDTTLSRTVNITARINGAGACDGGIYIIDFGDGTESQQPYPADACRSFTREVVHTYPTAGSYTVRLLKNGNEVDRITVSVVARSTAFNNIANAFSAVERFIRSIFE
jgi:PKD repeat protein